MAKTSQDIVDEIVDYIKQSNVAFSSWYVGVASKPKARLFDDHNVKEKDYWICVDVGSADNARTIEKFLLEKYKTQGGGGGGDETTKHVYAYAITSTTKE